MFAKSPTPAPKKLSDILPPNLCNELEEINRKEDNQNSNSINNNQNQNNSLNVSKL